MKNTGGTNGRRIFGPPQGRTSATRDKDLELFKELRKREKDRIANLLLPISEEFELTGSTNNHQTALFRIPSNKKSILGLESLSGTDKNDYDWLKTPPTTPLFPSLEMEAGTAPEMVVQRELPLTQPLSWFSSSSQQNQADPNPKTSTTNKPKPTPTPTFTTSTTPKTHRPPTNHIAPRHPDPFLKSNLSKLDPKSRTGSSSSSSTGRPRSRGSVSQMKKTASDRTPTNLEPERTRSVSLSRRGRGGIVNGSMTLPSVNIEAGSDPRPLSVNRSRVGGRASETAPLKLTSTQSSTFFGSKMVDKVMSARKNGGGDASAKATKRVGEFGRAAAAATRSSLLDMSVKPDMETKEGQKRSFKAATRAK